VEDGGGRGQPCPWPAILFPQSCNFATIARGAGCPRCLPLILEIAISSVRSAKTLRRFDNRRLRQAIVIERRLTQLLLGNYPDINIWLFALPKSDGITILGG
jgi:hypothetical protein